MMANIAAERDPATRTGAPRDITPDDIRVQLQRIVAYSQIAKSPRLKAFLEYVVEESLGGRASRIKAFSVGQAVFGGDESFDPQTNTIVRVEAGRLRRRISQYYLSTGRDDPIRIDIPKGTYAPEYVWNETGTSQTGADAPEASPATFRGPGRRTAAVFGAGALIVVLGVAGWWFFSQGRPAETQAVEQFVEPSGTPLVVVLPIESISGDPIENQLSGGLAETIITDLSKLSGLSVMAHASMLELGDRSISINTLRRDFGVTHLLRGSLEREGNTVRIHTQLIDTATSSTIWADSLDGTVDNVLELEDKVANKIVAALAVRMKPDERARFLHRYSTDSEALLLYRQAMTLLWAPNESARLLTARRLFRRISEIDRNFAGGLAGESLTFSLQVLFQQSAEPTKDLEMAASLAKTAIEIDVDFGLGHATHGLALTLAGRFEEGVSIARQAVAVQPGYAYSQWVYGLVLVLSRDMERAIKHMTQALRLDPSESRTPYLNVIGIAHFVAGDYAAAIEFLDRNLERDGPTGPHMNLFHAGAYANLGQEDAARAVIDAMLLSYPDFPEEAWLAKWLDSDSLNETLNNLFRMGLPRN